MLNFDHLTFWKDNLDTHLEIKQISDVVLRDFCVYDTLKWLS